MVIRIPGFLQGQHEQPAAHTGHQQSGPQPGPDPAWARFSVEGGGDSGVPRKVSLRPYKPDVAAYRVLGAAPLPGVRAQDEARTRNRHNTGVYVTSAAKATRSAAALRLPVVGEIAAGAYDVTVAFQDYDCLDGGLAVDKAMARGGAYALRVRGTSMTHVGIEPGDFVVIRPQTWADDGDFVVANYVDGEAGGSEGLATLKRIYKRRDHVFLQSATASTDPIRLFASRGDGDRDPVRIQGVVTMVVKAGAGA
jgi:SOS-response transcriptional repressor LexA